jgi:protease II
MKISLIFFISILLADACLAQKYPYTKIVDSSDTWHNITIKDPYRWMEDLKSDETQNWFKDQNEYTKAKMDK